MWCAPEAYSIVQVSSLDIQLTRSGARLRSAGDASGRDERSQEETRSQTEDPTKPNKVHTVLVGAPKYLSISGRTVSTQYENASICEIFHSTILSFVQYGVRTWVQGIRSTTRFPHHPTHYLSTRAAQPHYAIRQITYAAPAEGSTSQAFIHT